MNKNRIIIFLTVCLLVIPSPFVANAQPGGGGGCPSSSSGFLSTSSAYLCGSSVTVSVSATWTSAIYVLEKQSGSNWQYQTQINTNSGSVSFNATSVGTYRVKVQKSGCSDAVLSGTKSILSPGTTPSATISRVPSSTTSICPGSSFYFTADAGSNYKWYRDGSGIIGTAQTYSPGNDATGTRDYWVIYDISGDCGIETKTSPKLSLTINPSNTPSVSLNNPGSVCPGNQVTFTATPSSNVSVTNYAWTINGAAYGGNTASINYTPAGTTSTSTLTAAVTISGTGSCLSPTTANASRSISVHAKPGSVSPSPSNASYCEGENGDDITVSGHTSGFTYYWSKSGGGTGGTITPSTSSPFNFNDLLEGSYTIMSYNPICGSGSAISVGSITVSKTTKPANPTIQLTGDADGTFCISTSAFLQVPSGHSNYQWTRAGVAIAGATSNTYYPNNTSDLGTNNYNVTYDQAVGSCTFSITGASDQQLTVQEQISPSVSLTRLPSGTVCEGTSVTFTATNTTNITSNMEALSGVSYSWKINGVTDTNLTGNVEPITINDNTTVEVTLSITNGCATSTSVSSSLVADVFTAAPTLAGSPYSATYCQGGSGSDISIANHSAGYTYYWIKDGGTPSGHISPSGSEPFTFSSLVSGSYVIMAHHASCLEGTAVQVGTIGITEEGQPANPTIQLTGDADGTFCISTSAFLQVPSGHSNYQWTRGGVAIAGATSNTYYPNNTSDLGTNNYNVTYDQSVGSCTFSMAGASDQQLTVQEQISPSVSLTRLPSGTVCEGTSVTFTATNTTNITSNMEALSGVSYSWKINGVTDTNLTGNVEPITINDNTTVEVTLSITNGCATSTSVSSSLVADVFTAAPTLAGSPYSATYCQGGSGSDISIANHSAGYTYYWIKDGGTPSGHISPSGSEPFTFSSLVSGSYVIMAHHASCLEGTAVQVGTIGITEEGQPANPTIQLTGDADGTFCISTSAFLQVPSGHSNYQWTRAGVAIAGATSNTYYPNNTSDLGTNNYNVTYDQAVGSCTFSMAGASDQQLTVQEQISPSVSLSGLPSGTVCEGTSVTFTATNTTNITSNMEAMSGITYSWKVDGTSVGTGNPKAITINGNSTVEVTMSITNACAILTSTVSSLVVNTHSVPSAISGSPFNGSYCEGENGDDITVSGNTSGFTYYWTKSGGGTGGTITPSTSSPFVFNDLLEGSYTIMSYNPTCGSGSAISVGSISVSKISKPANPTIQLIGDADGTFCISSSAYLQVPSGHSNYQWKRGGVAIAGATANSYYPNDPSDLGTNNYNVTYDQAVGSCTFSMSGASDQQLTVQEQISPSVSLSGLPSGTVCEGTSVTFTATNTTNITSNMEAMSGVSYSWKVGGVIDTNLTSNQEDITITENTTVEVTLSIDNTCVVQSSATTSDSVNIFDGAAVLPGSPYTAEYCIGDAGSNVSIANHTPGYTYYWIKDGGVPSGHNTPVDTNPFAFNGLLEGTYAIMVLESTCLETTAVQGGTITVSTLPLPAVSAGDDIQAFVGNTIALTDETPTGGNWSGNAITVNTFDASAAGVGSHTITYSYTDGNGCFNTDSRIINVNDLPVISFSNSNQIAIGETTQLSVPDVYSSYQWKKDNQDISGANISSISANEIGTYKVSVTNIDGYNAESNEMVIYRKLASDENYVMTWSFKESGMDPNNIPEDVNKVSRKVDYFDGLGRPTQAVVWQASPGPVPGDLVQPVAYDEFGRVQTEYLPFVDGVAGLYNANFVDVDNAGYAANPQALFYANSNNKVATDVSPFAKKIYERSPLSRVLKQGSVGEAWQPDPDVNVTTDKVVRMSYDTNTKTGSNSCTSGCDDVMLWSLVNDLPVSSLYDAGSLFKTTTADEDGNKVVEFTDQLARVVLKMVETDDSINPWAQTHYVYDDFNNLRFVLPPMVFDSNETLEAGELDDYAFQYKYDLRNRMVEKKVPGSDWVYLIYDDRDRLVLTQDANQRINNQWLFTKYDALNRPVSTGFYTNNIQTTRPAMQNFVDAQVGSAYTWYETQKTIAGNTHGYDNMSFPNVSLETDYLTVTYYDNYNFLTDVVTPWSSSFDYSDQSMIHTFNGYVYNSEISELSSVKGQVTGGKVRNLATDFWLKSVTYYDDRYRVIQSIADNNLGALDKTSNLYEFTGKLLQTKSTHDNGITATDILRTFDYDHADRLLTIKHKIGTEDEIILVDNEYNELGELVDKKLHSTDGTDFMQSVDYRYNIRGWLASMNNSELIVNSENDEDNDFFGFELAYNEAVAGVGNSAVFNGNISAMTWSNFQKIDNVDKRAYSYSYDPMNRLQQALHYTNSAGTFTSVNDFKVSGIQYDLNGNIESLQRLTTGGGGLDDLSYTYANGNQLSKVDDGPNGNSSEGFKDGVSQSTEYTYDANGNMINDANKGIESIDYNHLNLPIKVDMGGNNLIEYEYDATGVKLKQTVYESNLPTKVTDYVGEFIYETKPQQDNVREMQFVQHEEGRLTPLPGGAGGGFDYQYHLKDHLGNTRTTFTSGKYTSNYLATMEDNLYDQESADFFNLDPRIFYPPPSSAKAVRLNNAAPIGPGLALAVSRGDTVNMSVTAYYTHSFGHGTSSLATSTLAAALTSAYGGVNGGSEGQQLIYDIFNVHAGAAVAVGGTGSDTHPSAYLNYLVFDNDYNLVASQTGYVGVLEGENLEWTLSANDLIIEQPGFIYIYVSNESSSSSYVYFDNLDVSIKESPVLETTDYYPFGLTFGKGSGTWEPATTAPSSGSIAYDNFTTSNGFVTLVGSSSISWGKLKVTAPFLGIVTRTVPTQAGSTLDVSFYFQYSIGNMALYVDGVAIDTYSVGDTGQIQLSLTGTGSDMVFQFRTVGWGGGKQFYLDDFTITETVESAAATTSNSPYFKSGMIGQNFKYNGMEEVQDLGLNLLFPEEFRTYDPALGRFMQIDPVIKEHESVYAWNTNNPILYPDPLGSDSTERANAVAQAKLFKTKNSGNDYGQRDDNKKIPKPGEKNVDCSGLVRACINKGTGKDPFDGTSHKKADGTWKRGVEILVDSEGITEIEMSELEVGSMVTLNNSSTGKDKKKDLGHAGIISSITRGEDGNITDLKMIDSGGRPSTGKSGPRYQTLISGGVKKYYGKRITGAYKWDPTPDIYNGGTMRPITIRSTPLGNGGAVKPRKISTL